MDIGTPGRAEMRNLPSRAEAAAKFGLDPARPTLMVTGGSQGARRLNSLVAQGFADFPRGAQVLHIAGPLDQQRVEEEAAGRDPGAATEPVLEGPVPEGPVPEGPVSEDQDPPLAPTP